MRSPISSSSARAVAMKTFSCPESSASLCAKELFPDRAPPRIKVVREAIMAHGLPPTAGGKGREEGPSPTRAGRNREPLLEQICERDAHADLQSGGLPIEVERPAELADDALAGQQAPEPLEGGDAGNGRPSRFGPVKDDVVADE